MEINKRVIIVSNRLPVKIKEQDGEMTYHTSEGGLATGLASIYKQNNNLWIGWPGAIVEDRVKTKVEEDLQQKNLLPIFLTQQEINEFYEGFSNETIWPLFHYFPTYTTYNPQYWESYKAVNQKFADAILKVASKDDVIWIHDYQLMLVPQMVRDVLPEVSIGFFQHIPFPSYEIFRILPWRKELLQGVLGADVLGFHTYDDVRHFLSATTRILNIDGMANELTIGNRKVAVDAFPISIDYKKYRQIAEDNITRRNERKLKQLINHNKLVISIDRLDYSKGIIHRLRAYELFLQKHPELRGKVTMIQLVVPSRDNVPQYKELKEEMNRMVSEINGRFSTLGWQPIQHFYRSFPIHLLSALYKAADVALVTPMRDGMNLVSKEYIASKIDQKGVLVLSETAGASRELSDAVLVNPNDIWEFSDKIYSALNMPEDEQKRRMAAMQQTVARFDIFNWVNNFMDKLAEVKAQQQAMYTRRINTSIQQKIGIRYYYGQKRLIFLDYDGTLVPFHNQVDAAIPDKDLLSILKKLSEDPHNTVVITSGRDYNTLQAWLGHLPLDMIAEHGAWYRDHGKEWRSRRDLNNEWRHEIHRVMDMYARRTPGAFIEEKSFSLAWHYRKVEEGLGSLRAHELMADIKHFVSDQGLQLLQGDKVIEIKSITVNKGKAAKRWLEKDDYDFVMAIGDDYTDEDTFKAMPDDAITIKVGNNVSAATYFMSSYAEVRALLHELYMAENIGDQLRRDAGILKEAS
ncbi:bifunctional alpha,alpha-trehalose-phosphate synthase (UDP-forming)/trehalose-phosphatase [Polluticoccus soli]|uniref:bifunctional alpha,alpha-trehalose-phosphate synthase (UDP-forming)/trehalose-phosphatase n=1 Tax=Polluticoccus soli TaxID=3034150 RepID=UPI0023E092ED|nr:bifunctional alpha,alpha-trehalose-phosphate synthase (UDP-forming)/trehalose-phosphatase [Flavipsychrobacter sp. JY13-12]